jgi:hypothetical protein
VAGERLKTFSRDVRFAVLEKVDEELDRILAAYEKDAPEE